MSQGFVKGTASVNNNEVIVTLDNNVDASHVSSGTAVFIGGYPPVEAIGGTIGQLTLRNPWTYPNQVSAPFTSIYTIEGLVNAVNNAVSMRNEYLTLLNSQRDLLTSTDPTVTVTINGTPLEFIPYQYLADQASSLLTDAQQINADMTAVEGRIDQAELDLAAMEGDITTFNTNYSDFVTNYSDFVTDYGTFNTNYTDFNNNYPTFSTNYSDFVTDYGTFSTNYSDFVTDYGTFSTNYADFVTDYSAFNGSLSTFQTDLTNFNINYSSFDSNYTTFQTDFADFNVKFNHFNNNYPTFQTDYADFSTNYADFVTDYGTFNTNYADFNTKYSDFITKYDGLIYGALTVNLSQSNTLGVDYPPAELTEIFVNGTATALNIDIAAYPYGAVLNHILAKTGESCVFTITTGNVKDINGNTVTSFTVSDSNPRYKLVRGNAFNNDVLLEM